jgi:excisionase family DNA binding protein
VREVAQRLRSSPETVRRWLRQGKLRGFRPGGTKLGYRVAEDELERFIKLSQARQIDAGSSDVSDRP